MLRNKQPSFIISLPTGTSQIFLQLVLTFVAIITAPQLNAWVSAFVTSINFPALLINWFNAVIAEEGQGRKPTVKDVASPTVFLVLHLFHPWVLVSLDKSKHCQQVKEGRRKAMPVNYRIMGSHYICLLVIFRNNVLKFQQIKNSRVTQKCATFTNDGLASACLTKTKQFPMPYS